MSLVEEKYNEALDLMNGRQRVERTLSLFDSIYEMLALQVSKEFENLGARSKRKIIAQRLYLSDSHTQELLARVNEE